MTIQQHTITRLAALLHDESGATSIEYALIATLVSVGALVGYTTFAQSAGNVWTYASATILAAIQ